MNSKDVRERLGLKEGIEVVKVSPMDLSLEVTSGEYKQEVLSDGEVTLETIPDRGDSRRATVAYASWAILLSVVFEGFKEVRKVYFWDYVDLASLEEHLRAVADMNASCSKDSLDRARAQELNGDEEGEEGGETSNFGEEPSFDPFSVAMLFEKERKRMEKVEQGQFGSLYFEAIN